MVWVTKVLCHGYCAASRPTGRGIVFSTKLYSWTMPCPDNKCGQKVVCGLRKRKGTKRSEFQATKLETSFQWNQVVQDLMFHQVGTTLWAKGMQLENELLQPNGLQVRELAHSLIFETHLSPRSNEFLHLPWDEVVVMDSVSSVHALPEVTRQQAMSWSSISWSTSVFVVVLRLPYLYVPREGAVHIECYIKCFLSVE